MAYSEWYQGYLRQEHEEALRRERGASRQHATFSQKSPAPRPAPPRRPPTVQEQLAALSTVIYAARQSTANREAFEARMTKEVLAQPFRLNGTSIYKRRAAEVQAHRLAASQGLPKQPEKQVAPVMPSADSIYKRRALQAQGLA
jgi:hypothetical protein